MSKNSTVVDVLHVSKSYGKVRALSDLSFHVEQGEIFGLLGPNGAGKTTMIRIMLDIYQADAGSVAIFGSPMTEKKKDRIGYLPEERGLYQDVPLERCLIYLAVLKGVSHEDARQRIRQYLERFDLLAARHKKVKELSKGMQQKAQMISALVHTPDLLIIDEPFTALDPVNTQMVKDMLRDERRRGRTIIMSTHQMHQVEELCDRILLVDHGTAMLYGEVEDIRRRYAGREIVLKTQAECNFDIPGIEEVKNANGKTILHLNGETTSQMVLRELVKRDVVVEHFEIGLPSLDDIFIQVVKGGMHTP